MSFIVIEADEYILKIHQSNFLEFIVKEGSTIDVDVLMEARKIVKEYKPDSKVFVLAEGEDFFTITKEARELLASRVFTSHISSIAFFSTNLSLIFMGQMYNNINKPAVELKIFHSRYSANEWLTDLMHERVCKSA